VHQAGRRGRRRPVTTSRGDANDECRRLGLPTFLVSPWGRHRLYQPYRQAFGMRSGEVSYHCRSIAGSLSA
jgi:hypothetical protein